MSRSWIRTLPFVLAAASVAALAHEASAGDVVVQRVDRQIFVLGEDASDAVLLTNPSLGVLRIETQDATTTTVDGTDFVELQVSRRDSVFFLLGEGLNSVRVESLPPLRRITAIVSGAAADDYTFDGASLTGDLVFNGGTGADRLTFSNGASVGGSLFAFTGGGGDQVSVTDARVGGEVVVALGDGFPNSISLDAFSVNGPAVLVGGAGIDLVTVTNCTFAHAVRMDLGGGADEVGIGAGNDFQGKLTVRGGSGPDTILVSGDPRFALRVLVDGGEGDDIVDVGLAHFEAPLRLYGGDDDDTFRLHEFTSTSRVLLFAGDGNDVVDVDETALVILSGGELHGELGDDVLVDGLDAGMVASGF